MYSANERDFFLHPEVDMSHILWRSLPQVGGVSIIFVSTATVNNILCMLCFAVIASSGLVFLLQCQIKFPVGIRLVVVGDGIMETPSATYSTILPHRSSWLPTPDAETDQASDVWEPPTHTEGVAPVVLTHGVPDAPEHSG